MLLQQICLLFGLFWLSSAREVPVKGYQILINFQCNGLPLVGTVYFYEKVLSCSEINLHLDIPDRETVLELLEPSSRRNVSYDIACGSKHLFTDPVLTVFHNCPPPPALSSSNESSSSSAEHQTTQHQEEVCKKWQIEVPAENIGLKAPVLDLGVAELSGLGDTIECRQAKPQLMSQEEQQQVKEFKEEDSDDEMEIPVAVMMMNDGDDEMP